MSASDEPVLSVVIPCMGRLHHLQESVPPLLTQPQVELILVDYSCPHHCGAYARLHWPTVKVVEVLGQQLFNKCRALNAGFRAATGRWLAIVDADNVAADRFADMVLAQAAEDLLLVYPYVAGGVGFLVCATEVMRRTGGYNESFRGWGAEDDDMRCRLLAQGLRLRLVPPGLLRIIDHGDAERVRHYHEKDRKKSREANMARMVQRLDADMRWPWPDPVTFTLSGQGLAHVFRSVQYALFVRRRQQVRVRLHTQWHGPAGVDFAPEPLVDRSDLIRRVLDILDTSATIDLATDPPVEELQSRADIWLWWFPFVPTRPRWRGWVGGPRRRIACHLAGQWRSPAFDRLSFDRLAAERCQLLGSTAGIDWIELDERLPLEECVLRIAESDLFIGTDGGLIQVAYAVGVPVLLLTLDRDVRELRVLHGDQAAIWCKDVDDCMRKVHWFLGLP